MIQVPLTEFDNVAGESEQYCSRWLATVELGCRRLEPNNFAPPSSTQTGVLRMNAEIETIREKAAQSRRLIRRQRDLRLRNLC